MGEFLILAPVILPPAIQQRLIPRPLGWACIPLAIGLLVIVNSATLAALTVLLLYTVLALFANSVRIGLVLTAFVLSFSCLVVLLIVINLDAIFTLTGRDATLTLWALRQGRFVGDLIVTRLLGHCSRSPIDWHSLIGAGLMHCIRLLR